MRDAILFAVALSVASCGDGDGDDGCGAQLTCARLEDEPGYRAGSDAVVPDPFPEPPDGSTLCGDSPDEGKVYYLSTVSDEEVLDHYAVELVAIGWTPGPRYEATDRPCDSSQVFSIGMYGGGAQVYCYGTGGFEITFAGAGF